MTDKKELGKRIWTTVLPAGKKTLSIRRYEKAIVLRKNKKEIIIELDETEALNWAIKKFQKEKVIEIDQ